MYVELQEVKKQSSSPEQDYYNRINSYSGIQTDFFVRQTSVGTGKSHPIFINLLPKITYLTSKVLKNSATLAVLYTQLTAIEQEELLDYLFIEEMIATSKLSQVSLKRKTLSLILQQLKEQKNTDNKLASLYYSLVNSQEIEISVNQNIKNFLQNQQDELPKILKIFLAHYLLETASSEQKEHELTRFSLSYHLAQELDIISSLSISQAILARKDHYQKAFHSLDNLDNYGEATFYLIHLLELLLNQQNSLITFLERNAKLRNQIEEQLKSELQKTPFAYDVFEVYFDHALYYPNELLSRKNILSFAHKDISSYMMRKIEALLLDMALIEKRGEKPVTYRLNPKIISNIDPPI